MEEEREVSVFKVEFERDSQTGRVVRERWFNQYGHLDRPDDQPSYTDYCPELGTPVARRWHDGSGAGEHRLGDKPARIVTRALTGVDICEFYMILGKFHREGDNPAAILRTDEGMLKEESYWKFGKLHRDPNLGPALISYNTKGKIDKRAFWVNGKEIISPTVQQAPSP